MAKVVTTHCMTTLTMQSVKEAGLDAHELNFCDANIMYIHTKSGHCTATIARAAQY